MGKEYANARSYLATITPFPITDKMDDGTGGQQEITYPSVEHYVAAMKFKLASNMPDLAVSLFSRDGEIHQKYTRARLAEMVGAQAVPYDRDIQLLKEEMKEVQQYTSKTYLNSRKYKVVFDDGQWATIKGEVLREGLRQRLERDAKYRDIVMKAREKGLYLLNRVETGGSELGGKRTIKGKIDGQNKIGVILMDLAGFSF
jgi:predicted NAD-dependent protein-ADP-ribosyltransferase YbiA (DUF1768 family)